MRTQISFLYSRQWRGRLEPNLCLWRDADQYVSLRYATTGSAVPYAQGRRDGEMYWGNDRLEMALNDCIAAFQ